MATGCARISTSLSNCVLNKLLKLIGELLLFPFRFLLIEHCQRCFLFCGIHLQAKEGTAEASGASSVHFRCQSSVISMKSRSPMLTHSHAPSLRQHWPPCANHLKQALASTKPLSKSNIAHTSTYSRCYLVSTHWRTQTSGYTDDPLM